MFIVRKVRNRLYWDVLKVFAVQHKEKKTKHGGTWCYRANDLRTAQIIVRNLNSGVLNDPTLIN